MTRNRTVSSSAIARAVSDAAAGETMRYFFLNFCLCGICNRCHLFCLKLCHLSFYFSYVYFFSAIETLVTAISLIKQSKVAHDERCKILISSLQDTLNGIESKSYRRSRSRERSHRSERRSERPRRSSRERSTSKERRYRERSRERSGRYYESGSSYRDGRSRSRDRNASGTSGAGNSGGNDHYSER